MRLCLWGLLAGCPRKAGEPDAGVAAVDSGLVDAGLAEVFDAGPPQELEVPMVVMAPLPDGGSEVVDRDVEPVSTMRVWIPVALTDYRLRVFDETDRVLPSDDVAKEIDGGIDYQITFQEPLKSGRNYRMTIESQLGQAIEGYKDAELLMKVRGQIEPENKKPQKKKKR